MSTTTASSVPTNLAGALNNGGNGQFAEGQTINVFFASLAGAFAVFGIQFGIFLIIKNKFTRI